MGCGETTVRARSGVSRTDRFITLANVVTQIMSNTASRADEIDETDAASSAHLGDETDTAVDAHLTNVADGAGCTEIWETLSEQRDAAAEEANPLGADETDAE